MELAEQRAGIKTHLFTIAETAMSRHVLMIPCLVLGFWLLGIVPAMAATQPTLYTINSGTPKVLGQGVQKSWPIKVNENNAFDAVFKGGMWLPNPAGGQIYVKYQRHILHDNGTWTWIGTTSSVRGEQSVVLTFGKDGVFGLIPLASGYPLRIATRQGQTSVIETSARAMARSSEALRLYSQPDYLMPPPRAVAKGTPVAASSRSAANAAIVPPPGAVTIDVMVAYTPGFVTEVGTQSLALTRIQNLVDITNTAYAGSGVNQRIRLVNTVEVNYPDNTSNQSALDDLTGFDPNGNPVPIPASLQGIASLRTQYGADLVTLIRSFDSSAQGGCGIGWLIGGGQTAIVPSKSYVLGYNVVSDGTSDNGSGQLVYCLDTTFAHELGHNMGDAHDRANAGKDPNGNPIPGAYSYSFGYLGNGDNGFSTIMAYGTPTTHPVAVFSNPEISVCQNTPCGVADTAPNSADNAHSMNNTASLIAQFEPTMVPITPVPTTTVRNDVNGDGYSDIFWRNRTSQRFAYWLLEGDNIKQMAASVPVANSYSLVADGNFDGNTRGLSELVWDNGINIWLWQNTGSAFSSALIGSHPAGWSIVGGCDLDDDGKTDLLWRNNADGRFAYWLMNGASVRFKSASVPVSKNYRLVATGDFNGDGRCDLVWDNGINIWEWQSTGNGFNQALVGSHPAGWDIVDGADVDGDGLTDLIWISNDGGRLAYWIMNGAKVIARAPSSPILAGYTFVGVGDFNGDGMADILWASPSSVVEWFGNGQGFGAATLANIPSGWIPMEP
jgi:hypothetical protein